MAESESATALLKALGELADEIVETSIEFVREEYGFTPERRAMRERWDALIDRTLQGEGGDLDALRLLMTEAGYSEREVDAAVDGTLKRQLARQQRAQGGT